MGTSPVSCDTRVVAACCCCVGQSGSSSLDVLAVVALGQVVLVAAAFADVFADELAPFDALLFAGFPPVLCSDDELAGAVALPAALVVPLFLLQL